jgi:hypothetical protein
LVHIASDPDAWSRFGNRKELERPITPIVKSSLEQKNVVAILSWIGRISATKEAP